VLDDCTARPVRPVQQPYQSLSRVWDSVGRSTRNNDAGRHGALPCVSRAIPYTRIACNAPFSRYAEIYRDVVLLSGNLPSIATCTYTV